MQAKTSVSVYVFSLMLLISGRHIAAQESARERVGRQQSLGRETVRQNATSRKAKLDELFSHVRSPAENVKGPETERIPRVSHTRDGYVDALFAPRGGYFDIENVRGQRPEVMGREFLTRWRGLLTNESPALDFKSIRQSQHREQHYVRYQQMFAGIEVFGAQAVVRVDPSTGIKYMANRLMRDSSTLENDPVAMSPAVDALTAERYAETWMEEKYPQVVFRADSTRQIVFVPELFGYAGTPRLAWYTEVREVSGLPVGEAVIIDARMGSVVFRYSLIKSALRYTIEDRGEEPLQGYDNDTTTPRLEPTEDDSADAYLLSVYLQDAYDFFNQSRFGWWQGLDNNDGAISATVRDFSIECNADAGMHFGTGIVTDDTVGHEYTHNIVDEKAGLVYSGESGAISESFADMFGEWIDQSNETHREDDTLSPGEGDGEFWALFEDDASVDTNGTPCEGDLYRSMINPKSHNDPDTYMGECWVTGSDDHDIVHSNNGVGNKLAYLLSETGLHTHNGIEVQGLGVAKASELFFWSMSGLTSSGTYRDWALALQDVAENLLEAEYFDDSDVDAVNNACEAVGIIPSETLYVDSRVADPGIGQSWQFAYGTLGEALARVATFPSQYSVEIRVATGMYSCEHAMVVPSGITLKVLGGFKGDGYGDPDIDKTIVTGSSGLFEIEAGSVVTFETLTFQGVNMAGYGIKSSDNDSITDGAYVTINYCTIAGWKRGVDYNGKHLTPVGNVVAGGGLVVQNSDIRDNGTEGGIHVEDCAEVTINSKTWFRHNKGNGLIITGKSTATVSDCTFDDNGDVLSSEGGGLSIDSSSGAMAVIVNECDFIRNKALKGGGILVVTGAHVIKYCDFLDNEASNQGGAIFVESGRPTMLDCGFYGNTATDDGGALACAGGAGSIIARCVFLGNRSDDGTHDMGYGGAIANGSHAIYHTVFSSNHARWGGGIGACDSSDYTIDLYNCTFCGNEATMFGGGAISIYSGGGSVTADNCIFWMDRSNSSNPSEDGGRIFDTSGNGGSISLSHCAIDGDVGVTDVTISGPDVTAISPDSIMLLGETSPFVDGSAYRLCCGSPCIDAGVVIEDCRYKVDIDGEDVPSGEGWDIGADEYSPSGTRQVYSLDPYYKFGDDGDTDIRIGFVGAAYKNGVYGQGDEVAILRCPSYLMSSLRKEIDSGDPDVTIDSGSDPITGRVDLSIVSGDYDPPLYMIRGSYVAQLIPINEGESVVTSHRFYIDSDFIPPEMESGTLIQAGVDTVLQVTATRAGAPVSDSSQAEMMDCRYPVSYQFVADGRYDGPTSEWLSGQDPNVFHVSDWEPGSIYVYSVRARFRDAPEVMTALSEPRIILTPPELVFSEARDTVACVAVVESDESTLSRLKGDPNIAFCFENVTRSTNSGWISDPNWIETGLTAETTYVYRMKFRYGAQESGYSNDVNAVTTAQGAGDVTPPRPNPMQWEEEPHAESNTSIGMTAVSAVDLSGPVMYYFECNDPCCSSAWQTDPCYVATGLTQGQLYSFKVKAKDGCNNETAFSSALWACADVDPPGNLTWYQSGTGPWSITLRVWATDLDPSDQSSIKYEIECLTTQQTNNWVTILSEGYYALGEEDGVRRPEWTHFGLQPNTQYQYRFRARDESDNTSDWSSILTVSTEVLNMNPPTPNPMQWASPYLVYQGSTMLTLQAVDATLGIPGGGVAQYQFECTSGCSFVSGWQSSPVCQVNGLTPNTTYRFVVRARPSYDWSLVTTDSAYIDVNTVSGVSPANGVARIVEANAWFTTINGAIEEAADGQTIEIVPGTYHQTLDLTGRELTLRGTDPDNWTTVEATVIDSDGAAPVVMAGAHSRITLEGLTITGADDPNALGGGVRVEVFEQALLIKCIVKENTAAYGGGVYGKVTATTCLFENNHASLYGGGVYGQASMYDCEFSYNSAGGSGGAVYGSAASMVNCVVHHNSATDHGGGLESSGGDVSLAGCVFYTNSCGDAGGGVCHRYGDLTVTNCTFLNNTASTFGGGLYSLGCDNPRVTNCIFWGNTASSLSQIGGCLPYLYSCLVGGTYRVDDSVREQGTGTQVALYKGGAFLNTNPNLTNEYHLPAASPCIDAGLQPGSLPVTDIDGHRRVMGDAVDIGADEYFVADETPPSPSPMTWAIQPTPVDCNTITMTASTATDVSLPVVYYFECTSHAGYSSGWQTSPVYVSDGLTPETAYTYQVRARDAAGNLTVWSSQRQATTPPEAPLYTARNVNTGLTYMTIQAAIDASSNGHVIEIVEGTHVGAIHFNGKDITLRGTDPNNWTVVENTVISGNGAAPVVSFDSGSYSTLEGLTVTGANSTTTYGGGVYVDSLAQATISKCLIHNNTASYGGGVYGGGSMNLNHCRIEDNQAVYYGGGVYGGQVTATNTVFVSNVAGSYGGGMHGSAVSLTNCSFTGNSAPVGGGLECFNDSTVVGCVFYDNSATNYGGGIRHYLGLLTLTNCTLRSNSASDGGGLYSSGGYYPRATNCIFWSNITTNGNQIAGCLPDVYSGAISGAYRNGSMIYDQATQTALGYFRNGYFVNTDPGFIDSFHLAHDSACIDKGISLGVSLPVYDIDGHGRILNFGVEIGADEVHNSTMPGPFGEELDTATLAFTTDSTIPWFGETTTYHYDGDAAQSGDISDDEESYIWTTVSGTGTVSFWWKVSSESYCDLLEFYIDATRQDYISGTVDWQQKTYNINTSGTHTLKWRYMKDSSVSTGSDCGWIDYVTWTP